MKSTQLKILRQAAKILKKDPVSKSCKTYCFGCIQCQTSHLCQEYISFVEDFLESAEEIERYLKQFDRAKKKFEKKQTSSKKM